MRIGGSSRLVPGSVAGFFRLSLISFLLIVFVVVGCSSLKTQPGTTAAPCPQEASAIAHGKASAEYIEAGRLLLTAGHPQQAALWLFRAYQQGDRDLILCHLLAEALRQSATDPVRLPIEKVLDGALSSDGRLVVLSNQDGVITLHDAESGRLLQTLRDPREDSEDTATEVMFLPDGRILSLHQHEDRIEDPLLWRQLRPGEPFVNQYVLEPDATYGAYAKRVMLSPDLRYLLIHAPGSWEGAQWADLFLYDLNSGKPVRDGVVAGVKYGDGSRLYPSAGVFSQDGSRILVLESRIISHSDPEAGEFDSAPGIPFAAKVIETASGKLIRQIRDPGTGIVQAQLAPDLRRLVTVNERGEVKVWQVDTGKLAFALDLQKVAPVFYSKKVRAVRAEAAQYTSDGKLIAVRLNTKDLVHWDADTGACASRECGGSSTPDSEYGSALKEPAADVAVEYKDSGREHALPRTDGGKDHGRTLVISAGTAVVKKGLAKGDVLPLADGGRAHSAVASPGEAQAAYLSTSGKLRALLKENAIKVFATADERLLHTFTKVSGQSPVFSSDDKWLAGGSDTGVQVWDLATGKVAASWGGHSAPVTTMAFSPDSRFLVTASNDWTARIYAMEPGQGNAGPLVTLAGHEGSITSAIFSPDGNLILTLARDKTARLWERHSGRELRTLRSEIGDLLEARFTAAGGSARISSQTGALVWDLSPENRPPEQIAAWLKCRVPFRVSGDMILALPPQEPLPTECWPR